MMPIFSLCTALSPALASDLTLEQAARAPNRSPGFVARDAARHPVEELRFFGVTPTSNVVEIWPGGGYWTEILAPFLHDRGTYHLAVDVPNGEPEGQNFALGPKFAARLDGDPADYGRIDYTFFGMKHPQLLTPNSVDVILTFRNLHNWVNQMDVGGFLKSIHTALKPGGILGVEDHRGNPHLPQDPKAAYGYLRQDYAIALIEKAGFELVGTSEIAANPRDTADYPRGVWTLPPTFALGEQDRARYAAIGEADNFVLKFRKVR
jgi:predicted methyltransferase